MQKNSSKIFLKRCKILIVLKEMVAEEGLESPTRGLRFRYSKQNYPLQPLPTHQAPRSEAQRAVKSRPHPLGQSHSEIGKCSSNPLLWNSDLSLWKGISMSSLKHLNKGMID